MCVDDMIIFILSNQIINVLKINRKTIRRLIVMLTPACIQVCHKASDAEQPAQIKECIIINTGRSEFYPGVVVRGCCRGMASEILNGNTCGLRSYSQSVASSRLRLT